jgi:hypothetical protein
MAFEMEFTEFQRNPKQKIKVLYSYPERLFDVPEGTTRYI